MNAAKFLLQNSPMQKVAFIDQKVNVTYEKMHKQTNK